MEKIEKAFQKIDAFPIVRLLQASALIVFLMGLAYLVPLWYQPFRNPPGPNAASIFNTLVLTGMTLGRVIFEPVVLLALAQILKGMQIKNT